MSLERIRVTDFRCLARVDLEPDRRSNIFFGDNASGKTSLLEAIFFLGRGRSFRTVQSDTLIRDEQPGFQLVGNVLYGGRKIAVGVEVGRQDVRSVRAAGSPVRSLGELAEYLPVQVVDPDVHKLVEEGPAVRRQFLDFGVFHVEQGFLACWRRYQRAMKQRNRALKTDPRTARAWDPELVESGEALAAMRSAYLEALLPVAQSWVGPLLGGELELRYRPGWPAGRGLAEALAGAWDRDRELGSTQVGPHRADVEIRLHTRGARGRISRGQQKLLSAAILLAQVELLERQGKGGVLLLDDPAAELDRGRLGTLMERVSVLGAQLFVTGLTRQDLSMVAPGAVFHVEQATLRRVV